MSKRIQLGVIGAGRIGRVHVENISTRLRDAEIAAITDVRWESAQKLAQDYGIANVPRDHREILADPKIDAVLICSSTDTHATLTQEAAKAGKHIFCEKPIDMDLERIRQTLQIVKDAGVQLQVGFNRRFDPNFRRIGNLVRENKIGAPHLVRITSRDPQPPPAEYVKVSGGMFLDMTIHDFDMARFLVPDEVVEVYATGSVLVDPAIGAAGDIDTAAVTLKYRNGAICVIDNSRKAVYGYDQRIEVFGSSGCLVATNNTPTQTQLWDAEAQKQELPLFFFLERYTESFVAEMREFLDACRGQRQPSVSGQDGLMATTLALAALRSLKEGRPVRLAEWT